MFCSKCGRQIEDDMKFCPYCGTPADGSSNINVQWNYNNNSPNIDEPNVLMNVLSFIFPMVGLILYIIYHDKEPVKANAIGKWALIGVAVEAGLYVLSACAMTASVGSLMFHHW